jgi:hypothetical protein
VLIDDFPVMRQMEGLGDSPISALLNLFGSLKEKLQGGGNLSQPTNPSVSFAQKKCFGLFLVSTRNGGDASCVFPFGPDTELPALMESIQRQQCQVLMQTDQFTPAALLVRHTHTQVPCVQAGSGVWQERMMYNRGS